VAVRQGEFIGPDLCAIRSFALDKQAVIKDETLSFCDLFRRNFKQVGKRVNSFRFSMLGQAEEPGGVMKIKDLNAF
jgi:hypothetical protein